MPRKQQATVNAEGQLSERAQQLLKTLVERYIVEGEPVGSRQLSRDSGLDLSPATVRNIMADLEEIGMVRSPHTSAGRVPTVQGYRLFVDALLTVRPLTSRDVRQLQHKILEEAGGDSKALLATTSDLLSGLTRMAGVVSVPRRETSQWSHVEFLPLSDRRVLAILVMNEREVQNRILHLDRDYSRDELQIAANYLNAEFAGRDVSQLRSRILNEMQQARQNMNDMMSSAIRMADAVIRSSGESADPDYLLAGETNLMEFEELSDIDKLRQLFDTFKQKRDILHLLDRCTHAEGVQIYIGEESGYQVLDDLSVVTAPYEVSDDQVGVLGVIGPTRMAYERVIPIVDMTAKLLTAALNPRK
ncbi:MAG: heat-inducible transcriptional repressor HrcA [Gammaproteobacteria bacterium]|nr:heat-inducible transcriptional repressor HrcA [Gammaproteobacteria bacterium]